MATQTAGPAETTGKQQQENIRTTPASEMSAAKKVAAVSSTAAETPAGLPAGKQAPAIMPDQKTRETKAPLKQLPLYDDAALALAKAPPGDDPKQKVGRKATAKENTRADQPAAVKPEKPSKAHKPENKASATSEIGGEPQSRISAEIAKIDARTNRLAGMFAGRITPENLSRLQAEEKISGFKDVLNRYRGTKDLTERGQLRGMELEKKDLEESVYGKGFRFRKLFETLGDRFRNKIETTKKPIINDALKTPVRQTSGVRKQLIRSGFIRMLIRADQRINRGDYNFSMTESKDLGNGKTMDYKVVFGPGRNKNEKASVDRIEASYFDQKDPDTSRTRTFDVRRGENYTRAQMATLMSGGAVYIEKTSRLGISTGPKWAKIDFNDVKNGQYRMQTTAAENKSFYQARLEALPGIKDYQIDKLEHLLGSLLNGNKESVNLKINGKKTEVSLEMDARYDRVSISDSRGKPVSLDNSGKIIDINSRKEVQKQHVSQGKHRKAGLKAT